MGCIDVSEGRLDVVVLPEEWFVFLFRDKNIRLNSSWSASCRPLAVCAIVLEPSGGYERGIIRPCSRPTVGGDVSTPTSFVSFAARAPPPPRASWPRINRPRCAN